MSVSILIGDVFARLAELPDNHFDCAVTSPPYWGLRDYGVEGQIGMETTLGEHLDVMVSVFGEVRRVLKPEGTLWLNYGDCYATKPNGRSAADTKAAGKDDRTFRDKPFSTVGPVYDPNYASPRGSFKSGSRRSHHDHGGRILAGGTLKPKDLCMVPNRLAIALQDDGWWVRSEIIWDKLNPMPDSSGRYRPSTAHEKIWLLTKTGKSYYDSEAVRMPSTESSVMRLSQDIESQNGSDRANGGNEPNRPMKAGGRRERKRGVPPRHQELATNHKTLSDFPRGQGRLLRNCETDISPIIPPEVWSIATAAFRDAHFATFPPDLVVPCILAGCPEGGTVLDPFGGAGTTGMVADRLGRNCTLIELNPEYAELAKKRIVDDAGLFAEVPTC